MKILDPQHPILDRIATTIAAGSAPAAVGIWALLDRFDVLLRILISAGSLVLILVTIYIKIKVYRARKKETDE